MLSDMNDVPSPSDDPAEILADHNRRIAWEAEGIARARDSVRAGRVVDEADVDAWIASIGTDGELPVPYSDRRTAGPKES